MVSVSSESAGALPATFAVHVGHDPLPEDALSVAARLLGAQQFGQPAPGHGDQPPFGVVRHAITRPLDRSSEERFLDGVPGEAEIAVTAHQRPKDLRRQLAHQVLELGGVHGAAQPSKSG